MASVKYQIVTASTGSNVGLGDILISNSATIYAVVFRFRGVGGAGGGYYSAELTVNNGGNAFPETNNPIRGYAVAASTYAMGNAAIVGTTFAPIPVSVRIKPGDRLYLNITQTGTAAASQLLAVDIYVNE